MVDNSDDNSRSLDAPRLVAVNGSVVRIVTHEDVADRRRPVLLINGIGTRLEMWQRFASALSDRRILMFDFPGVTGGSAQNLPIDMPGLAVWLTQLMDTLNIEDADVLGYSWGGVLAQQLARDSPRRVRALILASTNFGFGEVPAVELLSLVNLVLMRSADNPLKLFSAAIGGSAGEQNPIDALVNALSPSTTPLGGYLHQLFALTGWSSLSWLEEIHVPTLVLAGSDDPYVPVSTTRRLAESIPDARLELITGGGHLLPVKPACPDGWPRRGVSL